MLKRRVWLQPDARTPCRELVFGQFFGVQHVRFPELDVLVEFRSQVHPPVPLSGAATEESDNGIPRQTRGRSDSGIRDQFCDPLMLGQLLFVAMTLSFYFGHWEILLS